MRRLLLFLTLVAALALTAFVYRQAVVEGAFGPAAMFGSALLLAFVVALATLTYLSGTRHRAVVGNLLLALFMTGFTYAVLDIVLGWILIVPLSPPLVPDAYRHHALVPNSYAELRQPDFAYLQRVNTLGLRGRETTLDKPADTRRIVMLGDSFTMGKGVQDNETFPMLVEKLLQPQLAACGGGSLEVLNGGVDSYAPVLSALQLQRDLLRFSPDLVVENLDNSDLIQESAYRRQAVRNDRGEIVAVPQVGQNSRYEQFLSWTTRHLFLTRVLLVYVNRSMNHHEVTVRRVVNEATRESFAHTLENDVDRSAQWNDLFESVVRIKQLAEGGNAKFMLSTYPWAHQLGDAWWVPGRYLFGMKKGERTTDRSQIAIRTHAAAAGIDLFEALPTFQAYRGSEPLYFNNDNHWTAAGQRVMAEGLARYIADHYLTRWCTAQ